MASELQLGHAGATKYSSFIHSNFFRLAYAAFYFLIAIGKVTILAGKWRNFCNELQLGLSVDIC